MLRAYGPSNRYQRTAALLLAALWGGAFPSPAAQEPSRTIFICKKNAVGAKAPDLKTPQDAANVLRNKPVFTPLWIYRNTIGGLFTALKHVGFRGWTDYCSDACATGSVVSAVGGNDGFWTVDLVLQSFLVNAEETRLEGSRAVRVEFFPDVRKQTRPLPQKGDTVRICGKLMWDGDGFIEIHPQCPEDVEILVPAAKQNADPKH